MFEFITDEKEITINRLIIGLKVNYSIILIIMYFKLKNEVLIYLLLVNILN